MHFSETLTIKEYATHASLETDAITMRRVYWIPFVDHRDPLNKVVRMIGFCIYLNEWAVWDFRSDGVECGRSKMVFDFLKSVCNDKRYEYPLRSIVFRALHNKRAYND